MIWHEGAAFEGAQKVADFYNPKQFEVKLDLNQSPSVPTDEFVCANLSFTSEVSRDIVRFAELFLSEVLHPPPLPLSLSSTLDFSLIIRLGNARK